MRKPDILETIQLMARMRLASEAGFEYRLDQDGWFYLLLWAVGKESLPGRWKQGRDNILLMVDEAFGQ